MLKVKVISIHGIGNEKPGYSKELIDGVRKEFESQLRGILKTDNNYSDEIQFKEIVWEDILSENQAKLKDILRKSQEPIVKEKGFWKFIIFWLTKGYQQFRSDFVTESICDIIGYKNDEVYKGIHQKIKDGIDSIKGKDEESGVTFISHSLGTVIGSDFIYDSQNKVVDEKRNFKITNFFTLGSPLALFSLRYGQGTFKTPIKMEDIYGRWVNILDKNDPIAYKLKILNDDYAASILKDYEINMGISVLSHLFYWGNTEVSKIISRKLALDWIRMNNLMEQQEIDKLYSSYDNNLGLS